MISAMVARAMKRRPKIITITGETKAIDLSLDFGHSLDVTVVDDATGAAIDHAEASLVNLASAEYFKVVPPKALDGRMVTCVFEDWKGKESEGGVISFLAKYARGLMARFIVDERVDRADGIKDFAVDRYKFRPRRSTEDRWVFGRKHRPGAAKKKR